VQGVEEERETRYQAPALDALAYVVLEPSSPTWPQIPIEIVRHPIRGPPMIVPEPHPSQDLVHSRFDPDGQPNGSSHPGMAAAAILLLRAKASR
jgi:hypothetical protein